MLEICLNLVPDGPGSQYLFGLGVGALVRFTGPWGTFVLPSVRGAEGAEHPAADLSIRTTVANDTGQAAKFYRQSAEQGLATAQNNLASLLAKGDGVTQDLREAMKWWMSATNALVIGSISAVLA